MEKIKDKKEWGWGMWHGSAELQRRQSLSLTPEDRDESAWCLF